MTQTLETRRLLAMQEKWQVNTTHIEHISALSALHAEMPGGTVDATFTATHSPRKADKKKAMDEQ